MNVNKIKLHCKYLEKLFCGVACKYTSNTGESGLSWNNKEASFELSEPQTAAESASASKHKASQGNLLALEMRLD